MFLLLVAMDLIFGGVISFHGLRCAINIHLFWFGSWCLSSFFSDGVVGCFPKFDDLW